MKSLFFALAFSNFHLYPGFLPGNHSAVEAVIDRGPVKEMIINCGRSSGIIQYDSAKRVFCLPRGGCLRSRQRAIARLCR